MADEQKGSWAKPMALFDLGAGTWRVRIKIRGKVMIFEVKHIQERMIQAGLGVKDAMALLHMTLGDQQELTGPLPEGIFQGLHSLMNKTVRGATIERFRPSAEGSTFHVFEIQAPQGQPLGYLNMMYLRKPLPCYYLVYVEVLTPFRRQGLGSRILEAYRLFLEKKGCLGLLDNIIPPGDPTFHLYTRLGYRPVEEIIGMQAMLKDNHYMVWIPSSLGDKDVREGLLKLLFNLQRKRAVIDMKDNESMVERTIEEFRSVYRALTSMFQAELQQGTSSALMRFMFTKFTTKLLGFKRRISKLLGYTGGESLEQIRIQEAVAELVAQPWSLWGPQESRVEILDPSVPDLPESLRKDPTGFIEALPLYRRPYLGGESHGIQVSSSQSLRIRDLLALGFDPTRLREWDNGQARFVFERSWPRFEAHIRQTAQWLSRIGIEACSLRFRGAQLQVNPPLALLAHKGNLYVLRRKLEGIHLEEALDQLGSDENLRQLNKMAGIDRAVLEVVRLAKEWLGGMASPHIKAEVEDLTFFVPWDLERNFPKVSVEVNGVSVDKLWLA